MYLKNFLFFFIVVLFFSTCARFRINELKQNIIFSIPVSVANESNQDQDSLLLQKSDHVILGLPFYTRMWDNNIIISDYFNKQINIYNKNSQKPFVIIGQNHKDTRFSKEAKLIKSNFQFSGSIKTSDQEKLICFVAFKEVISKKRALYPVGTPPERPVVMGSKMDFNKSDIVCLNDEFEMSSKYEPMQFPITDLYAIQNIYISKQSIGILHSVKINSKKWEKNLSIYDSTQNTIHYNIKSLKFLQNPKFRNKHIEVEEMVLSPIENEVYLFIALHNKKNYELISKTLYKLKDPSSEPEELYQTDDPSDFFACPLENGGFYIKNTNETGNRILFKIFSNNGEYIKNVRITLPGIRASWRETFCTNDARIFSNRLYRGQYELYEWK